MQRKQRPRRSNHRTGRFINERGDGIWQLHGRVQRRKLRNRRARKSSQGNERAAIEGAMRDLFFQECNKMGVLFGRVNIEDLIT
jgi:hypothetical protein